MRRNRGSPRDCSARGLALPSRCLSTPSGAWRRGDVKFLAVAGLFTGPHGLVMVWVVGNLLGLAHALLACAMDLRARTGVAAEATIHRQFSKARGVPYAAYLAVGMLLWMGAGSEPHLSQLHEVRRRSART